MSELLYKPTHIYTSGKGADFLSWDEWMKINATDEEKEAYLDPSDFNEVKNGAYNRWVQEEQILTHTKIDENDNVIFTEEY
jgi:hypothetical protein